jgi:hypothetical protein
MYDSIKVELWGIQQALQSNRVVSTALGEPELGDASAQLHRPTDTVKSRLRRE